MHSKELTPKLGGWIQAVDLFAHTGSPDRSTNLALYFEVLDKGLPLNLEIWLRKRELFLTRI